jgi:hypothetical protein
MAKDVDDIPSIIPIAAVRELTAAEWELGIPPVLKASLGFQDRFVIR